MVLCTNCKNDVTAEDDYQAGYSCCPLCGAVLVEGTYESAVTYCEEGGMIGQIVSDEQRPQQGTTSERGFHEVSLLVDQLRIHPRDDTIDAALRLYKMAVVRGFLKGRRSNQVAGCCIYIICRTDKRPYLLIDFSDALRVNVYVLGCVFLDLCCLFKLDEHPIILSPVDPSLFIHRYVDRLNFGNKASTVTQTALKLIKSMNRDWIQTGRKPSGICAAALFIASHMHGVPKTKRDIIYVARIGVSTVAQRLTEFSKTRPGRLNADEFHQEALKMEECERTLLTYPRAASDETGCRHLERGSEVFAIGMCRACYNQYITISGGIFQGTSDPPSFTKGTKKGVMGLGKLLKLADAHEADEEEQRVVEREMMEAPGVEEVEAEMDIALSSQQLNPLLASNEASWPSLMPAVTSSMHQPRPHIQPPRMLESSLVEREHDEEIPFDEEGSLPMDSIAMIEIDTLEDIPNEAVSDYILKSDEAHQKSQWWRELHADHLKKVAARKERPIETEKKRKRSTKKTKIGTTEYTSAFEAVKGMLEDKGLSSKINYDNLEALFAEGVEQQGTQEMPMIPQMPQRYQKKESFFMRSLSFKKSVQKPRKRLDGLFD